MTALGRQAWPDVAPVRPLLAIHLASLAEAGHAMPAGEVQELLALDIELNAQGLEVWLDTAKT